MEAEKRCCMNQGESRSGETSGIDPVASVWEESDGSVFGNTRSFTHLCGVEISSGESRCVSTGAAAELLVWNSSTAENTVAQHAHVSHSQTKQ